jgi:alpha-1,3-glucan synthase
MSNTAVAGYTTLSNATLIGVAVPLALAMFAISIVLFLGLPDYYRTKPGDIPSFYTALCKKHVVQVSNRNSITLLGLTLTVYSGSGSW